MIYDVRNTRGYLSKLVDTERSSPLLSVISKGNSIICTDKHASYTWDLSESQQYTTQPLCFQQQQQQVEDEDTQGIICSVSMTENTFVTYRRSGGWMEQHISNITTNESGQSIFDEAWSCAVLEDTPSVCRNTHFTRNDNVFLCYAEKDKVV